MVIIINNNEEVGISAEVAISELFNIAINPLYKDRSNPFITSLIKDKIKSVFINEIPKPVKHIAEDQNPVDFMLENGLTLSVKTNQSKLGKAAPQVVGQPTSKTYFEYFKDIIGPVDINLSYYEKSLIFKKKTFENIHLVMPIYWKNMFDCDYLLYIYNIVSNNSINDVRFRVFKKSTKDVMWIKENFTFTRTLENWNESCTLKYCNVTIGEFQVHNNRDCFKFRFNFKGIESLIEKQLI